MTEDDLVQRLAFLPDRIDAMRALVGGVTAAELRTATVSDEAFDAILAGVHDPNPKVRWWCIQLLDHLPDDRALAAFVEALDDPVPRVRRNAVHALGCQACKPTWSGLLPEQVTARLASIALDDPSRKVRDEARLALACRT